MLMRFAPLLLLGLPLLSSCAAEGETPSLAPRPMEYELSGRPLPPCLAGDAGAAPAPVVAPSPPDPQLAAQVETLLATAKQGQSEFAGILGRAQASAAKAGAAGSESWISAQLDVSRLEAARVRTADAAAELDALVLARSGAEATNPQDLQRVTAAADEIRALAEAQASEINRLNLILGGSSTLRHAPSPAPHNAQRRPADQRALATSDPAHISPAAPPRAGGTGSACRG